MNDRWEGVAGVRVVEWDHADGSIFRGYELPGGELVGGACMVVSPARQAGLDAQNAGTTAAAASRIQFFARCDVLFTLARTRALDAGRPTEERQMWEAIARLLRGLQGIFDALT